MRLPRNGIQLPDPALIPNQDAALLQYLVVLNNRLRDVFSMIWDDMAGRTVSGTLIVDNGTTRVTITTVRGKAQGITTAASSGATISWTPA
jgi:hypothetical protein